MGSKIIPVPAMKRGSVGSKIIPVPAMERAGGGGEREGNVCPPAYLPSPPPFPPSTPQQSHRNDQRLKPPQAGKGGGGEVRGEEGEQHQSRGGGSARETLKPSRHLSHHSDP